MSEASNATATASSAAPVPHEAQKAPWSDLLREGRALYSGLILMGTMLQALQILVMSIILPTVVADIGGARYYTWAAMLYTVGSIIGAAAVAPVWAAFGGARRGYSLSALAFLAGTMGCALAHDIGWLNASRLVQGLGGGLVTGGSMALIGGLFPTQLRTRILAMQQGVFTCSHLLGPVVGGLFAQLGWWRGSFWSMVPLLAVFSLVAYLKLPERIGADSARAAAGFPFLRLSVLSLGVFCVAMIGPVEGETLRVLLGTAAVVLIGLMLRLDRTSAHKLYPSRPFSLRSSVGLTMWILLLFGIVQTGLSIFLPLLLQVVHGLPPVFVSFVNIILSFAWTVGTFAVAGWSGRRERWAMGVGPVIMFGGMCGIVASTRSPHLWTLAGSTFLFGFGVGMQNVHLWARAMGSALKGEERITASALGSIRSVGTAFGAALIGVLASFAGLGNATEANAVQGALSAVFTFTLVPLFLGMLANFWMLHIGPGREHK